MDIQPFGTSTDAPTIDGINQRKLKVIKAFGCTVVSFDISADWSSQAGSLSLNLIEDEADGDRLSIPVIGSPFIFELREDDGTTDGNVIFEYVGIVDSFSRSASTTTKTYSASISSPLKILDASKVIMDGYTGLGGALEGSFDFSGFGAYDFGHNNGQIVVDNSNGVYHWFNVSNLINVFGILENEDELFRVPRNASATSALTGSTTYGNFGFAGVSDDGMPLVNLMWALHMGINHLPKINATQYQQTHGGNLLYGRHNYDINNSFEGIPYFYDFDALNFYNQVVGVLGPQFRVPGPLKSINEIIQFLCEEANFEYYVYIDINKNEGFGGTTLREYDANWSGPSNCSWSNLNENKFTETNGKYGGTIRIQTINKNTFFNSNRPFSNIAYSLLGLEVPDLDVTQFTNAGGSHPGKRPGQPGYGIADNTTTYMDPLDTKGLDDVAGGFTDVGTQSLADGGGFPTTDGLFDMSQIDNIKVTQSNVSLSTSDMVTMKVITGGYQTRIVSVPRSMIKCYWGDISLIGKATDPRTTNDTATDEYGLNESSVTKIPVVTQQLDPRDIDDFIFVDMQSIYGGLDIKRALRNGIYAASMFEIRLAMAGFDQWYSWMKGNKLLKFNNIQEVFFPGCKKNREIDFNAQVTATDKLNVASGLGYESVSDLLNCVNTFTEADTTHNVYNYGFDSSGFPKDDMDSSGVNWPTGLFDSGVPCWLAEKQLKKIVLPKMHEIIKNIGDTHYGKSWYVPVPYFKSKVDLNGENLVGDIQRSWELADSAYVEPSLYYSREIPQTNAFIAEGKVSPFVNYDNDFVFGNENTVFSDTYTSDLQSPINGIDTQVYNFSEYDINSLAFTKYGDRSIKHAAPDNIEEKNAFLPYGYEYYYNRPIVPFTDLTDGNRKFYPTGMKKTKQGPEKIADRKTPWFLAAFMPDNNTNPTSDDKPEADGASSAIITPEPNPASWCWQTDESLFDALQNLSSLSYPDNGDFCTPYLKVTTSRVFLPILKGEKSFDEQPKKAYTKALSNAIGSKAGGRAYPNKLIGNPMSMTKPFPVCVCPRSINYAQRSTRYVYGPWMTTLGAIPFRGKVEYEQDDSLVPENFLIPLGFGSFGDFSLTQISGLTGLDLAAQGRANAIDNFALFAQEQGSITIQGAPAIKRIGDSLYGIRQVSDIKVSVANSTISTSYSFKTISPRMGKNNKDIEKKLTKISNAVNKLKLK